MKILNQFTPLFEKLKPQKFLITLVVATSIISSFTTYKFVSKDSPHIAVVDLAYLNNDFIIKLSRYLTENKMDDELAEQIVKTYLKSLESIIADIGKKSNYVLLQRQMVVSENISDVTKDIEKALFESVTAQIKAYNKQGRTGVSKDDPEAKIQLELPLNN
ncbi:MAG: TrbI F-type domain-containing protein [Myxococcaceae bacterium]